MKDAVAGASAPKAVSSVAASAVPGKPDQALVADKNALPSVAGLLQTPKVPEILLRGSTLQPMPPAGLSGVTDQEIRQGFDSIGLQPLPAAGDARDFVPHLASLSESDSRGVLAPLPLADGQIVLMPFHPVGENPLHGSLGHGSADPRTGLSPGTESPVTLREFRAESAKPVSGGDAIELRAVQRLTSMGYANQGQDFSVAEMTAPLGMGGSPFANLNLETNFRNQAMMETLQVRPAIQEGQFAGFWLPSDYTWITPSFGHRPLYFEQTNLERYGIRQPLLLEPVYSAADFFGTAALMPLKIIAQNPCSNVYTLGNQRPGDCAAWQNDPYHRVRFRR